MLKNKLLIGALVLMISGTAAQSQMGPKETGGTVGGALIGGVLGSALGVAVQAESLAALPALPLAVSLETGSAPRSMKKIAAPCRARPEAR